METAGRLVGLQELLRAGGFHPGEQTMLKRVLRELVKQGRLMRDGKRFGPAAPTAEKKPQQKSGPAWGGRKPGEVRAQAQVREKARPPAGKKRQASRFEPEEQPARRAPKGPPKTRSTRGKTVTGIIHHHRDGFAFVKPIVGQESEDLFIPPEEARKALDHDQVVVEVVPGREGRTMGRIVDVTSRTRQLMVGTYFEDERRAWVEPRERELGRVRVPKTQLARPGDAVKVRLGVGDTLLEPGSGLVGEVAGSLGSESDHSVEVLSVAFSKGFHDEFPPEVMDEADAISIEVSEKEAKGEHRRDLRKLPLITIDGEDARDFDDAVFCEVHPRGWRLVVAIADVSHYVRQDTALDAEALRRATSVYLPGRVLPMLPERLSNGICSLKPNVDRLCMVADMVIDRHGATLDSEIYPAVMRSAARCTYTEVHDVLNGKHVPGRTELKDHFERLYELSKTLTVMRLGRGAIDFDLPEQRVELGEDGLPLRLVQRMRWESHRLVEECMLAANEAVARFFREQELPTVNRFHGSPDEDRLDMFLKLLGAYGITVPPGEFTSKSLNAVLKQLEGHPEQRALNQLALRSMMQAVYSSRNAGHYGLGADDYLHFTSPIRRYPDLLVHRLLKELWKRGKKRPSQDQLEDEEERLEALAVQCSERERAAMQVEREVNQLYSCLLVKDRLGEEHAGTVAGLTENGFYVQLDELLVEGFVKGETLFPDFEFDQSTYRMTFGNGLVVKVGQKCRALILSVNMERKQIDFQVQELEGEAVESEPVEEPRFEERPRRRFGAERGADRGGGQSRFGGKKGRGERPYRSQDKGGRFAPKGRTQRPEQRAERPSRRDSAFSKGRGQREQPEQRDLGTTKRFGRMEPRKERTDPRFARFEKREDQRTSRPQGARFFEERKRREQPPPQPWQQKREEEREETEPAAPKQFDARAVLDRLWRERGGKRK
ncbi:MAG: ribonuclease R [Myxococcota bacterium]